MALYIVFFVNKIIVLIHVAFSRSPSIIELSSLRISYNYPYLGLVSMFLHFATSLCFYYRIVACGRLNLVVRHKMCISWNVLFPFYEVGHLYTCRICGQSYVKHG